MELYVGSKVILLRNIMNEKTGSVGYVFELYPDFDDNKKFGAQLIFQNGSLSGFSANEQDFCFSFVGHDPRYSTYNFKNMNQVYIDYRNGYWRFHDS